MINIPKGTKDILPAESYKWHYIEEVIRTLTKNYGYCEVRTPMFEHTELFLRGVGDTTDIVNKEMYTFTDKGDRSMTLKPEGTAGVARSFIENGLANNPQPTKMYYITPVFRYEKPQSGRLREHHQFGIELYGSPSPYADAEVIILAKRLFEVLRIKNLELNINSIGCPECRAGYSRALREYFSARKEELCPTCLERLEKNPLRILDCKVEGCKKIAADAPVVSDYLCDGCRSHHEKLKKILQYNGVEFAVNPRIVRGLDYYTGTVFEFVSNAIGSQGTVCGGGRYNNLVKELGGADVPAVGFGMGLERLIMVMENADCSFGEEENSIVYLAPLGEEEQDFALKLAMELRNCGISADCDLMGKSLKAQMKFADKMKYRFVCVIGSEEIKNGTVKVKDMFDKNEKEVGLSEITSYFKGIIE